MTRSPIFRSVPRNPLFHAIQVTRNPYGSASISSVVLTPETIESMTYSVSVAAFV
jgi:hypothetical protein